MIKFCLHNESCYNLSRQAESVKWTHCADVCKLDYGVCKQDGQAVNLKVKQAFFAVTCHVEILHTYR